MLVRAFSPLRTSCPHWSAILCNTGVSAHSQISAYDLSSSGEHSISSSTMERNHIPLRHTPQAREPLVARQWRLRVLCQLGFRLLPPHCYSGAHLLAHRSTKQFWKKQPSAQLSTCIRLLR